MACTRVLTEISAELDSASAELRHLNRGWRGSLVGRWSRRTQNLWVMAGRPCMVRGHDEVFVALVTVYVVFESFGAFIRSRF